MGTVLLVAFMKPPNLSIRGKPYCVFLQKTVMRKNTKKLVQALCQEHQIPLIKVDSNMKLGEWAGLCKLDKDGKARKVVKCSSCVVKDWGKESPALDIVKDYIKSQK